MTFLTFSFLHTHAKFFSTNKTVQNASEDDRTYRYTRDEGRGGEEAKTGNAERTMPKEIDGNGIQWIVRLNEVNSRGCQGCPKILEYFLSAKLVLIWDRRRQN